MPADGRLAALPRSLLHLRFLIDNDARPDVVLFRDEAMRAPIEAAFPGLGLSLGRETLPGRALAALRAARRANRAYYAQVRTRIEAAGITRLILFLEGEPLERYLMDLPAIDTIELWEDGLSHYVDLTHPLWYGARGAVQAAFGFHGTHILRRRIDRRRVTVRDRFERRNLHLAPPPPPPPTAQRDALLLIGSPLVEDRIIARSAFLRGLAAVAAASPCPVHYLPHPRETVARVADDIAAVPGLLLEPSPDGLMGHAGRYGYSAYAAAVSTGLLDLGQADRSIFVPALFGLRGMARTLRTWRHNPVAVADTATALHDHLSRLIASAPPSTR